MKLVPSPDQPPDISISVADEIFVKAIRFKRAAQVFPQHSHKYEHHTVVAQGSIRAWRDGKLLGDFKGLSSLVIPAGAKHTFLSLEPDTLLFCVHNIVRAGEVEVLEEHHIG